MAIKFVLVEIVLVGTVLVGDPLYSTVLGAAIKCKLYSKITVEIWTQLKTVKITTNIFAVWMKLMLTSDNPLAQYAEAGYYCIKNLA